MQASSTCGVAISGISAAWSSAMISFIGASGMKRTSSPAAMSTSARSIAPGRLRLSRAWMNRLRTPRLVITAAELTRAPSRASA